MPPTVTLREHAAARHGPSPAGDARSVVQHRALALAETPRPDKELVESHQNRSFSHMGILSVLYAIVVVDAMALMIGEPLMPEMFKREFGMDESVVGVAVGGVLFAYSFARTISAFYIGHLSDTHGRRPVLLFGLVVTVFSLVGFAFSPSYVIALLARFVGGLLNGNFGVVKAGIADVAVQPMQRSLAFGYLGGFFALSRCVSAGMAGLTVGIAPGGSAYMAYHEHLFPLLLGTSLVVIVLGVSLVVLRETNPFVKRVRRDPNAPPPPVRKSVPLRTSLRLIREDKMIVKLVTMNCVNQFANGGVLLGIILYSSLSTANNGLGFSTTVVGLLFFAFGIVATTFQFTGFKRIIGRYSLRATYRVGTMFLAMGALFFSATQLPMLVGGPDPIAGVGVFIALSLLSLGPGFMLALPVLGTMVTNVTPPEKQGVTQGVNASFGSLSRGLGPLAVGGMVSLLTLARVPFLVFPIMMCIYAWLSLHARHLPDSVERAVGKAVKESPREGREGSAGEPDEGARDIEMQGLHSEAGALESEAPLGNPYELDDSDSAGDGMDLGADSEGSAV